MKKILILLIIAFSMISCKAQTVSYWNNLAIDSTSWAEDFSSMTFWKYSGGLWYNYVISLTSPPVAESSNSWYFSISSGNDANDGHSSAYAKRSMTEMNRILVDSVAPGDFVYLKRGDTWTSAGINLTTDGSVGEPITLAAYGAGRKPIIDLSPSISGWSSSSNWTQDGTHWYYDGISDPRRLWVNGTEVKEAWTESALDANYPFMWGTGGNDTLYYFSGTNPATTFSSMVGMEMSDNALVGNNIDYYDIEYIDFRGANYCTRMNGGSNWNFDSCNIGWNSFYGFRANATGAYTQCTDFSFTNCTFDSGNRLWYTQRGSFDDNSGDQNTEDGMQWGDQIDGATVTGCSFINWAHSALNIYPNISDTSDIMHNILIKDNFFTAPDITYGRALDIQSMFTASDNIIIENNYIYNMPTTSQLISSNTIFRNNIIDSIRGDVYGYMSWGVEGTGIGLSPFRGGIIYGNTFNNNIFMRCAEWAVEIRSRNDQLSSYITENRFENNIFAYSDYDAGPLNHNYNTGAHLQLRIIDGYSLVHNNYYNNNIFYDTSATSGTELVYYWEGGGDEEFTVTEFNALTGTAGDQILNNVGTDPEFVDVSYPEVSTNYQIYSTSDGVDGGVAVSGYTLDKDGVSVGTPPNIGPYEGTVVAYFVPKHLQERFLASLQNILKNKNGTD